MSLLWSNRKNHAYHFGKGILYVLLSRMNVATTPDIGVLNHIAWDVLSGWRYGTCPPGDIDAGELPVCDLDVVRPRRGWLKSTPRHRVCSVQLPKMVYCAITNDGSLLKGLLEII